jgi:uncharacterized protein GlcG (DUF336 family)
VAVATSLLTPERKTVSLALANRLADAAVASCRKIGKESAVAVVDRGGNLVALQRGNDVAASRYSVFGSRRRAVLSVAT